MRNRLKILSLICLFTLLLGAPLALAESGHHSGSESDHGELEEDSSAELALPARGFRLRGVSTAELRKLSALIDQDGRLEKLHYIFANGVESGPNCFSCKPLLKVLANTTRPPRKRITAKKTKSHSGESIEAAPVKATIKQRLPSPTALDLVSRIFSKLAETENAEELIPAVDYIQKQLTKRSGKTFGERDYFSTLVTYMVAPFGPMLRAAGRQQEQEKRDLFSDSWPRRRW